MTPERLAVLQRSVGNQAVAGLIATVQRVAPEIDASVKEATRAKDWPKVASILDGLSDSDIRDEVRQLPQEHHPALKAALPASSARVRSALLDAAYDRARGRSDWTQAAIELNGFNDADIDKRVLDLDAADVWRLYQGANWGMSGVSRKRITDAVARTRAETVSPNRAADSLRLLQTMKGAGVDIATAAGIVLSQLGVKAHSGSGADGAGAKPDHEVLVERVARALSMSAVAAAAVVPAVLAEGNIAHRIIGGRYAAANPPSLSDPTIIALVRAAATALQLSQERMDRLYRRLPEEVLEQIRIRPDIVDLGRLEIFEIKSVGSAAAAAPEMQNYIDVLGRIDIPGFRGFRPGSPANPETRGELDLPEGGRLVWCSPSPGTIIYEFVDPKMDPHYGWERLMDRLHAAPVGVESMVVAGLLGALFADLVPAAVPAVRIAITEAAANYGALTGLIVNAANRAGQSIPTALLAP